MRKPIRILIAAVLIAVATFLLVSPADAAIYHHHDWFNCGHTLQRDHACWDTYKVRTVYTDVFHHVIHVTPWRLYAD